MLKLDERTLPSGYRVTTENPADERATRGKIIKINFGATVHRVVRLEIEGSAFDAGGAVRADLSPRGRTDRGAGAAPSILRVAYRMRDGRAPTPRSSTSLR